MDIWGNKQSALGYQPNGNGIDSYGVDHSGFNTQDELQYQYARQNREKHLIDSYTQQGVTGNYPQYGTDFWGSSPDNNYGFGTSDIRGNIEKLNNTRLAQNNTSSMASDVGSNVLSGNFSDEDLIERMLPVIKNMEKPRSYTYIDTTWNKTTGAGANVDNWEDFKNVAWNVGNRPATEEEKRAAFDYFDTITTKGKLNVDSKGELIKKNNYSADFYEDKSQLTIFDDEIDRLLRNHLVQDVKYLKNEFPEFVSYPPELQDVLLDIKFNTGNVSGEEWPKLRKAIADKNLFGEDGILGNVHRKDVGTDRNAWAERQIKSIGSW